MTTAILERTSKEEKIFTLGGAALPISDQTMNSEELLLQLELEFLKKLGLEPSMMRPKGPSKTINLEVGYTDTDEGF